MLMETVPPEPSMTGVSAPLAVVLLAVEGAVVLLVGAGATAAVFVVVRGARATVGEVCRGETNAVLVTPPDCVAVPVEPADEGLKRSPRFLLVVGAKGAGAVGSGGVPATKVMAELLVKPVSRSSVGLLSSTSTSRALASVVAPAASEPFW